MGGNPEMRVTMQIRVPQSFVDRAIDQLAKAIQQSAGEFDRIVGIANSGLHISKPLSTKIGLPHASVRISHYDGTTKRAKPIIEGSLEQPTNNLIVDDLIDGGSTIRTFDDHFGLRGNAVCVVWWNRQCGFEPQFYYDIKPTAWLILPWDEE